jgi:hypothetical protein
MERPTIRRNLPPLPRGRLPLALCGLTHGVGFTDLVKRATPRAGVLTPVEYRESLARVERLVRWLAPRAVCFVGLAGWRAAATDAPVPVYRSRPWAVARST